MPSLSAQSHAAQSHATQIEPDEQAQLERNLQLYPWYQALASTMPWLPVFFLYFIQFIPLEQVVRLSAIYYLAVVVSEVPSGYISDRFGRRVTLLFSALFLLVAYLVFVMVNGFYGLLVAEVFLAAGIAFQSGSDTSLLYDTLQRLGRETEYAEREAKAKQYSMGASAIACLLGGFSGVINLAIPYLLSAVAAVCTIALCWQFREPISQAGRTHEGFVSQVSSCLRYLAVPLLFWLMCFYVAGYCLQHVLYEFYQPYIQLLDLSYPATGFLDTVAKPGDGTSGLAPAVSGVIFGLSMFIGVLGARFGIAWFRALGLSRLLMLALAFQSGVIAVLGVVLHPLVLILVISRNFSMAMVHGPLMGAIAPHVDSSRRATYLSLQSLAARLGFSLWLFLLSLMLAPETSQGDALDWQPLSALLQVCAVAGGVCLVVLWLSGRKVEGLKSD